MLLPSCISPCLMSWSTRDSGIGSTLMSSSSSPSSLLGTRSRARYKYMNSVQNPGEAKKPPSARRFLDAKPISS